MPVGESESFKLWLLPSISSFQVYSLKNVTAVFLIGTPAGEGYNVWVLPLVLGELDTYKGLVSQSFLHFPQTASSLMGVSGSAETCLTDLCVLFLLLLLSQVADWTGATYQDKRYTSKCSTDCPDQGLGRIVTFSSNLQPKAF